MAWFSQCIPGMTRIEIKKCCVAGTECWDVTIFIMFGELMGHRRETYYICTYETETEARAVAEEIRATLATPAIIEVQDGKIFN